MPKIRKRGDLVVQKIMVGLSSFLGNIIFHLRSLNSPYVFLGNQEGMYIFFLGWLMLYDNSDYNSKVNKENQKLEFWMRGISIVSGFFCSRIFQFVGIDQFRGTNF